MTRKEGDWESRVVTLWIKWLEANFLDGFIYGIFQG